MEDVYFDLDNCVLNYRLLSVSSLLKNQCAKVPFCNFFYFMTDDLSDQYEYASEKNNKESVV